MNFKYSIFTIVICVCVSNSVVSKNALPVVKTDYTPLGILCAEVSLRAGSHIFMKKNNVYLQRCLQCMFIMQTALGVNYICNSYNAIGKYMGVVLTAEGIWQLHKIYSSYSKEVEPNKK